MRNVVLVLLLLVVPASDLQTQTAAERDHEKREAEADAKLLQLVWEPLDAFIAEKSQSCDSKNLYVAFDRVLAIAEKTGGPQFGFATQLRIGTAVLDVADAARNANCKKQARALYDFVITVYTGTGYAALRQRAQNGIDDLRVAR